MSDETRYLDQFPDKYRGPIANIFYTALRNGAQTDDQILWEVIFVCGKKRVHLSPADVRHRVLADVALSCLDALSGSEHAGDVRALVAHVQQQESMSRQEQQQQKAARQEQYVGNYMHAQDSHASVTRPTDAQLDYLRTLGYSGPEPRTRAEASDLIKQLKEHRQGSAVSEQQGQQRHSHASVTQRTVDTSGFAQVYPGAGPTEKQSILLKQLGYNGNPPQTKQEASQIIEQLLGEKKGQGQGQRSFQRPATQTRRNELSEQRSFYDYDEEEVRI